MKLCYCYDYGRREPKLMCVPGHLSRALKDYHKETQQHAEVVYVHPAMLSVLAPEAPKGVEVRTLGGCSKWMVMVEDVRDGQIQVRDGVHEERD